MKCKNCGAEIRPGTRFCIECGTRIEEDPIPAQPQYTPPQAQQYQQPQQYTQAQPAQNTVKQGSWAQYMDRQDNAAQNAGAAGPTRSMEQPLFGQTADTQPSYSQPQTFYSESQPVFTQPAFSQQNVRTSGSQPGAQQQEIVIRPHSTGGANALLISLSVLVFAALLLIYVMIIPGKSSSGKTANSGTNSSASAGKTDNSGSAQAGKTDSATPDVPSFEGENAGIELDIDAVPSDVLSKVKTDAVKENYYGNYKGTMSYQFVGGEFLKSMGMPADQIDFFTEISGNVYNITAVYEDDDLTGYSTEFPKADEDGSMMHFWIFGDIENGVYEDTESDSEDAYEFKQVERVYFLNDGSLFAMQGVVVRENGEIKGGAIYQAYLTPQG